MAAVFRRTAVLPVLYGPTTISGTTKALTVPVSRFVHLVDQDSMRVVRAVLSAADGTFSFPNMAAGRQWVLLSFDHTGAYNAVVADRVMT